jgi:hypothetical protein
LESTFSGRPRLLRKCIEASTAEIGYDKILKGDMQYV